jgi:GGDEF domain-containing protein
VSIGCAVYPESGENVTDVMQYADMNLYRAKRNGRNLVAMDDQAEHPTSGHARR